MKCDVEGLEDRKWLRGSYRSVLWAVEATKIATPAAGGSSDIVCHGYEVYKCRKALGSVIKGK